MLHLSTKGSKKSYVAKAACLTAGLVAVFASSSVLATNMSVVCTPGNHLVTISISGHPAYQCRDKQTGEVVSAGNVQ